MRSILILFVSLIPMAGGLTGVAQPSKAGELLDLYRRSPLLAHRYLRQQIRAGRCCRQAIEYLEVHTGDHSFEGLKIVPARLESGLRLRRLGADAWESGDEAAARRMFARAQAGFERVGANSEALFCLYLQAEVLAQAEDFTESLKLIRKGLEASRKRNFDYLTALFYQSSGFVEWFQDHLPDSAESFGRALEIWKRIPFKDGIVASWSNLALLYDELGLPERAEDCYLEALAGLTTQTEREIRGQLLLNYALFAFRNGRQPIARRFLDIARHYADLSPSDFALAEAEIHQDLSRLPARSTGLVGIQRRIQQADRLADSEPVRARRLLLEARDEAHRQGLRLFERRAALGLGALLEQQSQFEEAARHYRRSLDREEFLFNVDAAFPFRRAVSPFLDGWIRSLVELGRPSEARRAIHWFTRLRLFKTTSFLHQGPLAPPASGSRNLLDAVTVNALQAPTRLSDTRLPEAEPAPLPPDTSILELWPDNEHIYVWLDRPARRRFFRISLRCGLSTLLEELDHSLRAGGRSLPPAPARSLLDEASRQLLLPLESELRSSHLLIVPHKDLQRLPFELLRLRDGSLLGDRYFTSYLPIADQQFATSRPVVARPLILYSSDLLERETARRELEFLAGAKPTPRVIELTRPNAAHNGGWIHIAGHLRLDDRFWYLSRLGEPGKDLGIMNLLDQPLDCEMLVLAACNGARSRDDSFPYWMGASELLLVHGAQSLVMSRWQLDERTIPMLLDMYRMIGRGLAIDEALAEARRRFKGTRHADFPARHPLFWAGIIYVGWPGRVLTRAASGSAVDPTIVLLTVAVASGLWCAAKGRKRKGG